MNTASRSQLSQVLRSRCHAIADRWHKAIAPTSFVSLGTADVRQHLVELTEQVIALLLTEPFDCSQARAIGTSLAGLHYVEPEAIGRTQEVLAQQIVEGLPADQVVALQPRLAALLGGMASGFFQQTREVILTGQEQIRRALTTELQRAQEALRKAYEEAEQQVQERTAELRDTNESLQREITERKQIEEALRDAARQWHATFDAINDVVCLLDLEGRILRCNEAMAELLGKPFSEIIGRTCWELVRGASEPIEECPIARMRESRCRETLVLPRGDRWFNVSADPVLDKDGDLTGVVHIMTDITERKRAEEALRESEERYHSLFEGVSVGLYRITPDGHFLDVNSAMLKMLDYPDKESLLAVTSADLQLNVIPDEERQRRRTLLERNGAIRDLEAQLRRRDGATIWTRSNFRVVHDADDQVLYYEGSVEDITERKRAEEALQESEARYRSIVEDQTELICRFLPDGTLTFANEAYCRYFGKKPEDLIGSSFMPLIPEEDRAFVKAQFTSLSPENPVVTYEHRVANSSGEIRWQQWTDRAIFDEQRRPVQFQSVGRDITERKRAEEALRKAHDELEMRVQERTAELAQANEALQAEITERKQAEEELIRLSSAVKTSVDSIVIIDVEGKIIDVNEAALKMYGTDDKGDLIGRDILDFIAPGHREKGLAGIEFVLEKGYDTSRDYEVISKNGSRVPVELSAAVMKDAGGKPTGIVIIARDITERVKAEEYMLRTERLAAMGRLAAALAHEINNPLQAIGNSLELALDFPLEKEERQEYLQAARREIERLMALTGRVLNFARPSGIERQPIAVAGVVRETLALASKQLDHSGIGVSVDLSDVLPTVLASSSHLAQVFLNLIINAIEAMPDGGELSISVRLAGEQVEVTFTDSGPGISPDAITRLFEPFYTTKENGTGLGLATSHNIIQQHGGTITAGNAPGGGAVFTVALPIAPLDKPHLAERK